MSVLDQLSDLERQVVDRLRELEPLVGEYEQLRKVAGRLGVEYEPRSGTRDGNQPAPGPRRGATARSKSGQRNSASRSAGAAARPTTRARKSSTAAGTARRAARRRAPAPAGQREQQMLALVGERPGITVAEIAERLGVDATGLYRFVRRLTDAGQVRKDGQRLYPTSPDPAAAATPEAARPEGAGDSETAARAGKAA